MKNKKDNTENIVIRGPADDCNCPSCVFMKSQAPGDPYDLSQCPKCVSDTKRDILLLAKDIVMRRIQKENLLNDKVVLKAKVLSTKEAIGNPEKYDFPLIKGREKIIEADFAGHKGQAFTDMYGGFEGYLREVFESESKNNYRRAIQVATINALANYWGLVNDTVHCKDIQPYECARKSVKFIKENYPLVSRIAFVGYQPAFLDLFSKEYVLKVLDLDKDNIGEMRYGNMVLDGNEYLSDAIEWAELVISTGSTIVNGTINAILDFAGREKVIFYGITIAGVARLLGLKRICFS